LLNQASGVINRMSEKLIIKNFGPIKDVELELKKFNVIIGENATGKSTVAKILAMCRYFSYILENSWSNQSFRDGLYNRGLAEFFSVDSYIYYECPHYDFEIQCTKEVTRHQDEDGAHVDEEEFFLSTLKPKSADFKKLLEELDSIKPKQDGAFDLSFVGWTIPTSFFLNDVSKVLDNPFYLPTERGLQSIFSLGKSSIPNISDSLFNQFAELDSIARNFKNDTIIEPLEITYKNVDGRGYFKKEGQHDFLSLYNGASGYKSAIPIVLVIKYYKDLRKKVKTFLIEEPELNLFPKAQQALINYLVANTVSFGNSLLLTTHSPYILTSLSNLMYAYQAGQNYESEINRIVDKKYWVNPADVSAYMMLPNGECESILDREGLIKTEKIDGISGVLNKEFNEMFDIELAIKK
jgi:predicted ATPase